MPRLSAEARRQEIMRAALSLFHRDGFDAVRVEDILAEVSLSKGGFYHHFKSREDILRQIVASEAGELSESLDYSLINKDPAAALIELFAQGSVQLAADSGVLATLTSFESRSVYLDELETQLSQHIKPYLVEVIEQGVSSGVFRRVDSGATAEMVLAVNDHGNRCAILQKLEAEELQAYNDTALRALAHHLGIQSRLDDLLLAGFSGF